MGVKGVEMGMERIFKKVLSFPLYLTVWDKDRSIWHGTNSITELARSHADAIYFTATTEIEIERDRETVSVFEF